MKQDLFTFLPSEIFTDILLRLSFENTAICKCVCKPWRNLIESHYFLESHISKSPPTLVVSIPDTNSNWFNLFNLEDKRKGKPKNNAITKFDFPQATRIQGSANGLLFLKHHSIDLLYVCNPITREFVEIYGRLTPNEEGCYGFGVSRISGQHKVVHLNPKGCHVYTLESGSSWRRVKSATPSFDSCLSSVGAFVSGNLHWLLSKRGMEFPYVCCFDLETECFSTFSPPLECYYQGIYSLKGMLYASGDCLYFCDEGDTFERTIWLLKKYEQVEKRWCKACFIIPSLDVFTRSPFFGRDYHHARLQPIKVYKNGNMLMLWNEKMFVFYSIRSRSLVKIGSYGKLKYDSYYINSILLIPNFLSLKRTLGMQNVISF